MSRKPIMSFNTKLLINEHKMYFDIGFGILNYLKYLIMLFGLSSLNVKATLLLGIAFGVSCYVLGWVWFKTDFYKASIEVSNKYNLFVGEMRDAIKEKKEKKK